ncbi:MAG TPA: RsfS/YbeB/iojap family protein, partial [Aquifex aeolicus]|nr:RsfS/YbeB/iojap family protein [Aquifex aeolicus]
MEKLSLIKRVLEDRKASDILVLDVSQLTNIADFFIIATASSTIHARALAE